MIHSIQNLKDLRDILNSLNEDQLTAPYKLLQSSEVDPQLEQLEITEEPLLEHKEDSSDGGMESDLRAYAEHMNFSFNPNDYKVKEPVGTVYLYAR